LIPNGVAITAKKRKEKKRKEQVLEKIWRNW
jgi:hypothetical protein